METVDVKDLKAPVESGLTEVDLEVFKSADLGRRWSESPIQIDHDLNARVILYDGDIELLTADAIVNPTNESLTELSYVLKVAGSELVDYIKRRTVHCATGEVCITSGFNSSYKYIIHAVPPKYQAKYKTAAETALFHTYFRILEVMIERNIRTVVMPTLSTNRCNFPLEENCQLQLRVIRRILEKKRHKFDKIVVHVRDIESCAATFYSYFPRSSLDEQVACFHLPSCLGGPNGEPVVPGREIRIKSKPSSSFNSTLDNSIDLTTGLDLSTVVGKTAFSKMRDDLDCKAGQNGASLTSNTSNQISLRRRSVLRGCNLF